jgi:hypothetical protein
MIRAAAERGDGMPRQPDIFKVGMTEGVHFCYTGADE